MEGVLIWDMTQLIKEWLSDITIAHGLLAHMRPDAAQGNYPLLHSERAKHWRERGQVRHNQLCEGTVDHSLFVFRQRWQAVMESVRLCLHCWASTVTASTHCDHDLTISL